MEVNKANFFVAISKFEEALKDSDFVAFDWEFSGLSLEFKDKRHEFDSTEIIYKKMKDLCKTFLAFQIGFCVFKWDESEKKYSMCPFNFYVFPSSRFKDSILSFQATTLEFLTKHNMEWHKVFTNAIHYWQRNKAEELKSSIENEENESEESKRIYWYKLGDRSENDKNEMIEVISTYISKPTKEKEAQIFKANRNKSCQSATIKEVSKLCSKHKNVKFYVDHKDKSITITKYPSVDEDTKADESEDAKDNQNESMSLSQKLDNLSILSEEKKEEIIDLFQEEYGFTIIIDRLIESGVPIVGHNMIFDIMFLYNQFIDDLPDTYDEFTKNWASCFPFTYDTKLLSSYCSLINKTWLKSAFDKCLDYNDQMGNLKFEYFTDSRRKSFDDPDGVDFKTYDEEAQEHKASYDAYMTGVLFASIWKFKEIVHEAKGKLDTIEEYQNLKKNKEKVKDDKMKVSEKISEIEKEVYAESRKKINGKRIETSYITEFENKVVVVSSKNKVFYFGTNKDEIEKVKKNQFNEDKLIWVKLDKEHNNIDKLTDAVHDLADVYILKDDKDAYYIELQTIYEDKLMKTKDIVQILQEKLGSGCKVTLFKDAEKYREKY